ncbi:uncharacterized protein LOC123218418 [Mangifera indica]|uniref:uncharacterized protein LOC123218418 n=1 Tax=Mangifera indica TaxID=29780 RepID=UPI001CFB9DA8|nr:uncharacterized protein LOC123218418 [Mangifera indica]
MEGSDSKSIASKALVKIKSSSTSTDENAECTGLQNSKRSTTTKHFMSPTISTASKAIAPRKKILAERNEICDTHIPKPSNFSLSDDSLSFSDDSTIKSYDPLKNCTSPRPKFLRYKPDRRREFVKQEIKVKGMKEEATLICASEKGFVKEEVEEEEEEEEEEEREGFLRRIFKFVLVLFVLVFSTLYISSMNSPTCSHAFQSIEGLKDRWYPKIHDGVYEAMRSLRGEDHFFRTMKFKDFLKICTGGSEFVGEYVGLMKLNQTFINERFEGGEIVEEESDNLGEVVELQGGDNKNFGEMVELRAGESENLEGFDQMVEDVNLDKVEEVGDNLGGVVEPKGGESKDFCEIVELQVSETEKVEVADLILENFALKWTEEYAEKPESFDDNKKSEAVNEPVQEVNNVVARGSKMVESEHITDIETLNSEAESTSKEGLLEQIETDNTFMAAVGVALLFAVMVSKLMAFNLKKKRTIREESPPILRPCSNESEVMEKYVSEIPKEREEYAKYINSKDVYQSRGPSIELPLASNLKKKRNIREESPPILRPCSNESGVMEKFSSEIPKEREEYSKCINSKDVYQSQGPSIELLAEFEVGEISSAFRRVGMKKSRIEESEMSSHSVPLYKEFANCNKTHSISSDALSDFSEFSAMNSFSYAYITPEKKISKKEDVRDGEARKVATSAVRRSSRLRNRAITSP